MFLHFLFPHSSVPEVNSHDSAIRSHFYIGVVFHDFRLLKWINNNKLKRQNTKCQEEKVLIHHNYKKNAYYLRKFIYEIWFIDNFLLSTKVEYIMYESFLGNDKIYYLRHFDR